MNNLLSLVGARWRTNPLSSGGRVVTPPPAPTIPLRRKLNSQIPTMGNLCGKQDRDASPPGRVLGTTPATPSKASVPPKVGGPPHTLGVEAGGSDARRKAAEAAEVNLKPDSTGEKRPGKRGDTKTYMLKRCLCATSGVAIVADSLLSCRPEQKPRISRAASCKASWPRRRNRRAPRCSSRPALRNSARER